MRYLLVLVVAACASPIPQAWSASDPERIEISHGESRLRAAVYRPEGNGPFPAVVGLHGCSGLNNSTGVVSSRYRDWGQHLAKAGFAVVYPDSYGSRGLGNQCGVRARAVRTNRERVADANAALAWLQVQPWVKADRISLIGWSTGANSALWTVRRAGVRANGGDFRSAVALYPGCTRLFNTAWSARVPTLILVGASDEVASAATCQKMVAGARGRSAHTVIHVYPGAHHDFDHPNRRLQLRTGYAFSVDGTGRVHSGTNPSARADALKRVPAWLER